MINKQKMRFRVLLRMKIGKKKITLYFLSDTICLSKVNEYKVLK